MAETSIEWATHSDNYQAGCTKESAACLRCYAIPQSIRIENMGGAARYAGTTNRDLSAPAWTGQINVDREALARIFQGLRAARKPRRVFLNSMSDTFHPGAPEDVLAELARELRTVPPKHAILLLTKRSERMKRWARQHFPKGLPGNVWCGVTVENQAQAEARVPDLIDTPARVRFLSVEPMLGPIDLTTIDASGDAIESIVDALNGVLHVNLDPYPIPSIDWVIIGGESHRSARLARPTEIAWVEGLVAQCKAAGAAVFVKQMGTRWASTAHTIDRSTVYAAGDTKGARMGNWPASIQLRELPEAPCAK